MKERTRVSRGGRTSVSRSLVEVWRISLNDCETFTWNELFVCKAARKTTIGGEQASFIRAAQYGHH